MPKVDEILEGARDALSARRVFGEPIEQKGVTVGAYVIRGQQVSWVPAVDVSRIVLYSLVALLLGGVLLRRS